MRVGLRSLVMARLEGSLKAESVNGWCHTMPTLCKAQKDERGSGEFRRAAVTLGIWIDLMLTINPRSLIFQGGVGKACSEV